MILIFAAIIAAIWIYIVIREKVNLRRAATGEDKERLRRAVAQVLPGESGYQVAYGHYEDVQHYGRKKITTYYCYGLAFDASRIWVMPLQFEKGLYHRDLLPQGVCSGDRGRHLPFPVIEPVSKLHRIFTSRVV